MFTKRQVFMRSEYSKVLLVTFMILNTLFFYFNIQNMGYVEIIQFIYMQDRCNFQGI